MDGCILRGASAGEGNMNVLQADAFNVVSGHAGDLDAALAVHSGGDDVGDGNVAQDAVGGVGGAVAAAQGDVDRIIPNVHHGDVVDADVFHDAAVHFLQSQPFATAKGAVGHGDVAKTAGGFGAEFDPARSAAMGPHGA